MEVTALACAKCGAPLPSQTAAPHVVACPFCGAMMVAGDASKPSDAADLASKTRAFEAQLRDQQRAQTAARAAFAESLKAAASERRELFEPLREGLSTHLQREDADALARATIAIASDFGRDNGIPDARRDPLVLSRLAEALIGTVDVLPHSSGELNLPFLTSSPSGPKHLQRTITASDYAGLSARSPEPPPPPPPPLALEPTPEPPKKRWFFF